MFACRKILRAKELKIKKKELKDKHKYTEKRQKTVAIL